MELAGRENRRKQKQKGEDEARGQPTSSIARHGIRRKGKKHRNRKR